MASFNYAFQTGIGLNPYLLKGIESVFGEENAPALKIDNLGFLNLLQSQNKTLNVNRPSAPGAVEFVQVKYLQRFVSGMTTTSDTCANGFVNPYLEATVPLNVFRQIAIYIEDALIQEYTDDANRTGSLGLPPTKVMNEMMSQISAAANAILVDVDKDLQNLLVVGTNPATGSAAAATVNFTLDTTNLPLNDGLTKVLTQVQQAEFATGKPQIFGSGLMLNFMNQQIAKGNNQSGLNTSIEAAGVQFYYDQYAQGIFGVNQFLAISPDAVQLVEFSRYTGPYGGRKGISDFGSFVLPMQMTPTKVMPVQFDYQLRYLDCPSEVAGINDYYGTPVSGYRGWQMIISKKCGLFQIPQNSYRANDYLAASNGVLRYTATNV